MPQPAPKAVLFDWDNTLVDSWPTIHAAFNHLLSEMGMPVWSMTETKKNVGRSLREVFPEMFGDDWERAKDIYLSGFRNIHLDNLVPLPGAETMLAEVRSIVPFIGIVSNKTTPFLVTEIEHLDWRKYFDTVAGAGEAEYDKPHISQLLMGLEGSGLTGGRDVWFIGDSSVDMQAAANAGCTAVLTRPDPPREDEFPGLEIHYHVSDAESLKNLLCQTSPKNAN